ncbi:hypothetical protein RB195_001123 [Necator americanus]
MEDRISVVARIRPGFGDGQVEWVKNGERNVMRRDGSETYTFDDVFDQLCTNEELYGSVMSGIVDSALAGFNTTVCAYGQSGAGKTHTLTGSECEDGIVQNTFCALLETISKSSDRKYMLRISYLEIYNERIRDLLSDNANDLPIYENKYGVAQIEGLKEVVVTGEAEVERLLEEAQERRQFGETRLNERSSRSHTIIRLTIESHDVNYGGNGTRCSIMNLVDLAGSENAASAGTQGIRQKEGANINRSLLALSKVVSSLADNQKFIPFRDSKLTRILKPSLAGNSKTAIICCIAPFSIAETSSTLKFARQAKKIVTRPVVNEVTDDGVLAKCLKEIEFLKQELEKTKKENNQEERSGEQRTKLAELMKGILNGRSSTEAPPVHCRKARRQTWAPGNGLLGLSARRSFSPPCKKAWGLGSVEENEGQSNEKLDEVESAVMDTTEVGTSVAIQPPTSRRERYVNRNDNETQTSESCLLDRNDEILTLKKGNATLLQQLAAKNKRCNELETQLGEFAATLESMKFIMVNQLQEVPSRTQILEEKLVTAKQRCEQFASENLKLKIEIDALKVHTAMELDSSAGAGILKIGEPRSTHMNVGERSKEDEKEPRSAVLKDFQQQYSVVMKENGDEMQQLRKNNEDLLTRIEILVNERNSSAFESEEQVRLLKEKITELKTAIDRKSKRLEVAEKHKEEVDFLNKRMERLISENKDLTARLKVKMDSTEVLSSRINSLRDEMNEKQGQITQLQHAKKSLEVVREKLKEENETLLTSVKSIRSEFSAFRADVDSKMYEKDTRITHLLEQANTNQHRILVLDTDLTIARKDLELYKNTVANMVKTQDDAQKFSSQQSDLKEQLEVLLEKLSVLKKAKEKAEEDVIAKDKMLKKAMDAVTMLETTSHSSQWIKEKVKLGQQIEDLQRQVKDATEALEIRQAIPSYKCCEEHKRLSEENVSLRQQLEQVICDTKGKVAEVENLRHCLQESQKEMDVLKEKVRRYRMQKVNGIQYVDELKETIAKNEGELKVARKREASLIEELRQAKKARAELEMFCGENQMFRACSNGLATKKKSEEKTPLYEEPACKQQ